MGDAYLPVKILVADVVRDAHIVTELLAGDHLLLELSCHIC